MNDDVSDAVRYRSVTEVGWRQWVLQNSCEAADARDALRSGMTGGTRMATEEGEWAGGPAHSSVGRDQAAAVKFNVARTTSLEPLKYMSFAVQFASPLGHDDVDNLMFLLAGHG
jgi:hypothetical protein